MKIVNNVAILEDDSHISKWVEEAGKLDFDWYMYNHVREYVPVGGVVADCGSMIGDTTEFFRKTVGDTGRVHAFECNPRAFECLEYNMAKYTNVYLYTSPLSNVNEDYIIVEPCENIGMAFIEKATESSDPNCKRVKSMLLDDIDFDRLDVIKIDVEGVEIDVLDGAKNTIAKHSPILIIEVNSHTLNRFGLSKQDLFDKITSLGYTYQNIYNWYSIEESGEQFDVVCKKII